MNASGLSLPPTARRVLISLNPKAGAKSGRPAVERLRDLLRDEKYSVDVLSDIDELTEQAETLMHSQELRCVVSAGGDGTMALLANRLSSGIPIAVLPLGTENLLAKYLGAGTQPSDVCRAISVGYAERFDAGRAGQQLFLLMAGCGFDAEVVRRLHQDRTGHIRHLSYAKPIWDAVRHYDYPLLTVTCEAAVSDTTDEVQTVVIPARWAFVVNLPRYAGGLRIAPQASGQDGWLNVCTFQQGSLWHGLRYLSGIVLRQHGSWSDCVTLRAKRVRIESEQPVPNQFDGDPGGHLPIEIDVLPNHLTLLTSPARRP